MYNTIYEARVVCNDVFDKLGCQQLKDTLTIEFNSRMTRAMGYAWRRINKVKFSIPLFNRATDQQRYEVLVHEACHRAAWLLYGIHIKPHGREWKLCMRLCGVEPKRCHHVNRDGLKRKNKVKRYILQCKCEDGCLVSAIILSKIQKRNQVRVCRRCKGLLSKITPIKRVCHG